MASRRGRWRSPGRGRWAFPSAAPAVLQRLGQVHPLAGSAPLSAPVCLLDRSPQGVFSASSETPPLHHGTWHPELDPALRKGPLGRMSGDPWRFQTRHVLSSLAGGCSRRRFASSFWELDCFAATQGRDLLSIAGSAVIHEVAGSGHSLHVLRGIRLTARQGTRQMSTSRCEVFTEAETVAPSGTLLPY